ncbi:MAG: hypothetical protein H7172_09980 [Ferruginibacter sp.]|nr:hypothetical protein [Rhodoferax sp.]
MLRLIATHPKLLADHVEAYADLLNEEIGHASSGFKRRTLLLTIALFSLAVAVVFVGMALMLWAVVPVPQMAAPWGLIAVPLLPIVTAFGCLIAARRQTTANFENLRNQFRADMGMLREVSNS